MANIKRKSSVTADQIVALRGSMLQRVIADVAGCSLRQWRNFESGRIAMQQPIFDDIKRKLQQ